jgi:DNA helicase-2/ATP-dependent DNA helicase PcrA
MIRSFQILNQEADAFTLAEYVAKKSGLLLEFKKDGTPEGIARMENIEELLNGIKDFVEGQKELADAQGNLSEFLEDVALATDLDMDKGDEDRVALMTIHLAKGLEFPYVYIVGMEEDLFPSAMSMNTRSELEEERRLFYVALTRAEKQAYLTYTQNRYRWGKLIDAEPSRFLQEIDERFLDNLTPVETYQFRPLLNADIFGEVDKSSLRQQKPVTGIPPGANHPSEKQLRRLRRIKPQLGEPAPGNGIVGEELREGSLVDHSRFGKGQVLKIEGAGNDKKAEIRFERGDVKKLLLRFAKLRVLEK